MNTRLHYLFRNNGGTHMKRCPECNNLVEDRLKACNYCGYPFTGEEVQVVENQAENSLEENQKDEAETINNNSESNIENQTSDTGNDTGTIVSDKITEDIYPIIPSIPITEEHAKKDKILLGTILHKRKKVIGISAVLVVCIVAIAIYFSSDLHKYQVASKAFKQKDYKEAMEIYKGLEDYKDSQKRYEESKHQYAVSKDTTPPVIENIPEPLEVKLGEYFDAEGWIDSSGTVATDNVSKDVELEIDVDEVNIDQEGSYEVVLKAMDEAGNSTKETVTINIWEEYTQEEIEKSVSSIYVDGHIPNAEKIEYNKDDQSVLIYLSYDGLALSSVMTSMDYRLEAAWNDLIDTLQNVCSQMQTQLILDGYDKIESVSIILKNDANDDNVLAWIYNGTVIYDCTE